MGQIADGSGRAVLLGFPAPPGGTCPTMTQERPAGTLRLHLRT
jgi:hypothetical protein